MAGTTTDQNPQGDPAASPTVTDGQQTTEQTTEQSTTQTADEMQAELERTREALKKANAEAAERRRKLKELEDAQRAAERAGMDESARLAAELEDLKAATADRETLAQEAEALRTAVATQVDALLKELNVPKHILPLMESMSPAQKLTYLTENRAHFARPATTPADIDAANRGRNTQTETDEQKEARLKKRFPSLSR